MTTTDGTATMAMSIQSARRFEASPLTRFDEEMRASLRLMQRDAAAKPVWTVDWILTTVVGPLVNFEWGSESKA
jgi:hypothetical protein